MRLTITSNHLLLKLLPGIAVAVTMALIASTALANEPGAAKDANGPRVRIETLERGMVEGVLSSIDANRVIHVQGSSGESAVNLSEVRAMVLVSPGGTPSAAAATHLITNGTTCHLVDGGRITGRLRTRASRAIRIDPAWTATLKIPFEGLRAIRFGFPDEAAEKELNARLTAPESTRDHLIVGRNDNPVVLPGALEGLGPRNWVFRLPSRLQKAALDKAYAVVLGAAPGAPAARPDHFFLSNGDDFTGDIREANGQSVLIRSATFGDVQIDWSWLARMEFRSPMVTWLADTKFKSQAVKSALGVDWTPRANLNVTGGPIKLGGRTFAHGLGVHGTTSVSYDLDGKQSRLQATLGIDDSMGKRGSVAFRVIGDGRELFKSDILRGGAKPVDISVDITGVKLLELSTDAADGLDLGDHANWADLRMIRADGGGVS